MTKENKDLIIAISGAIIGGIIYDLLIIDYFKIFVPQKLIIVIIVLIIGLVINLYVNRTKRKSIKKARKKIGVSLVVISITMVYVLSVFVLYNPNNTEDNKNGSVDRVVIKGYRLTTSEQNYQKNYPVASEWDFY